MGNPLRLLLQPAMHTTLAGILWVYGFLPPPTMAPGLSDIPERSAVVRGVICYCQSLCGEENWRMPFPAKRRKAVQIDYLL
jgi:hypothetical protein